MRILHTIPKTALAVYQLPSKLLTQIGYTDSDEEEITLIDLCIKAIAESPSLIEHGIIEGVTRQNAAALFEVIPLDVPLSVSVPHVPDGFYWQRMSENFWETLNDPSQCEGSWKRLFLERMMSDSIENTLDTTEGIVDLAKISAPYVKRLVISQLQSLALDTGQDGGQKKCIHLCPILAELYKLQELLIVFGVNNCGMNFKHEFFQVAGEDCSDIGRGISLCPEFTSLSISRSQMNGAKLEKILENLIDCDTFSKIALSHCSLGDDGGKVIQSFIAKNNKLLFIDLTNNHIGKDGILNLLKPDISNITELFLSLNPLGEEGGCILFEKHCYLQNVVKLFVDGCFLGPKSLESIVDFFKATKKLKVINLSINNFGEEAGELLLEGAECNTSLAVIDVRMTGLSCEQIDKIKMCTKKNDSLQNRFCHNFFL